MNSDSAKKPNNYESCENEALRGKDSTPRIVSGLDHQYEPKPLGEQTTAVRRQMLMVFLGNVGILSAGMGLGFPTVTMRQLLDPSENIYLTESQASWFASINTLACPLGGLLSGVLLDKFGRKNTLYVLNAISLVSWAMLAFAPYNPNTDLAFLQLMISRFLIGVSMGLGSAPMGVYSAEISVPKIRGRLILGTSLAVASGITLIYLMGYFIRDDWQLIAFLCCAYQIMTIMCIVPLPESPSWLISKGRLIEARKSLNFFRGLEKTSTINNPEVAAEFNLLQKSTQQPGFHERKPSFVSLLRLPEVYKPLLILIGLFAFQQLTGIFVVIVYAVQIATEAGVSLDPFLCAVLIGVSRVLATLPMVVILEKLGRRKSGIVSALGMFVCMIALAAHGWFEWVRQIPYLPVIAILMFIILSTIGLYTLPFFMIAELFPQKVRGPCSGVTVSFGMLFAFGAIKSYLPLHDLVGNEMTFVVYGVASFAAMVFVFLVLPETQGRTLLEIEERFRTGNKRKPPNEVEMQQVLFK